MAHNKNARAAAQLLARRHCRVHAATGAPTISATKTAATMYSEPSRRTRSSANPGSSLWNIGIGFKFAPKAEAEAEAPSLYPTLDFKRFFHSQEAAAGASDNGLLNKASQPLQLPKAPVTATVKPDWGNQPIPSTTFTTTVVVEKATTGTSTACTEPAAQPPDTDLFKAALGQPKDSAGSFWSHTMYKSTSADGTVQDVQVHYCTSRQAMEVACQTYFAHEPVLGFDLEWVAYATRGGGPRQNVSLIQLASPGRIGLFHVALFPKADEGEDGGLVAPTFRAIMEDAAVDKVGVHIQADCTRLRNFLGVDARGVFELSHLYKLVKHAGDKQRRKLINKVPVALATQVQEILKLPLFKGESVRGSNWSKALTSKQLTFLDSAADAYAGLQLYHVLEERRLAMDPPPDRPRHAELRLPIPIPPTPVVSDVESDVDSDLESVKDSSSEFSDDSIEETMLELAMAESSLIAESSSIAARPSPSAATAAAQTQTQTPTRDARIVAAEAEMARLQASRARGRLLARPSALRTFYLWQANDDLAPADVARLLREPPLQTGTVIGYILDAIKAEKLAFPKERLRREVLSILHPTLAGGKYRAVVERCGQDET
ncbi:hypothetical protein ARSEF1564_006393 [Beauveria bassiana]